MSGGGVEPTVIFVLGLPEVRLGVGAYGADLRGVKGYSNVKGQQREPEQPQDMILEVASCYTINSTCAAAFAVTFRHSNAGGCHILGSKSVLSFRALLVNGDSSSAVLMAVDPRYQRKKAFVLRPRFYRFMVHALASSYKPDAIIVCSDTQLSRSNTHTKYSDSRPSHQ